MFQFGGLGALFGGAKPPPVAAGLVPHRMTLKKQRSSFWNGHLTATCCRYASFGIAVLHLWSVESQQLPGGMVVLCEKVHALVLNIFAIL